MLQIKGLWQKKKKPHTCGFLFTYRNSYFIPFSD